MSNLIFGIGSSLTFIISLIFSESLIQSFKPINSSLSDIPKNSFPPSPFANALIDFNQLFGHFSSSILKSSFSNIF